MLSKDIKSEFDFWNLYGFNNTGQANLLVYI